VSEHDLELLRQVPKQGLGILGPEQSRLDVKIEKVFCAAQVDERNKRKREKARAYQCLSGRLCFTDV